MGTYNLITEKKMEMNKYLKVTAIDAEGNPCIVNFDSHSENVVFQNTSYWGGGCYDMWDSYKDDDNADAVSITSQDSGRWHKTRNNNNTEVIENEVVGIKPQTHSDKLIEMMSFKSLFHMGQIQIGVTKADRLKQGR